MQYLISRHHGAIDWCRQQGLTPDKVQPHLDAQVIQQGDLVIGTLPLPLAAAVQARGGRYLHLNLPLTLALRGQELSAEQMTQLGASLQEFIITPVAPLSQN